MKDLIKSIPKHLQAYIVDQEYNEYTAIDHASWRYIMKLSKEFFAENAHPIYLQGLEETGITSERIPRISEMDEKLQKFGWRAVSITGFIPPAAFLEMLSLNLLPIACDMRKLKNIEYTPAPDIVHEAAGHAPIIADKEYASFLNKFGEVARRVIFAKEDCDVYEAVLDLSEVKEDPNSTDEDIAASQKRLDEAYAAVNYVSEATELTRIGWWSIEYGLIKDPKTDKFLIYGAGLLSSVGESYHCLGDTVKKVPFTLDCVKQDYDITKPQPQLFYSESFKEMENVIDEFAATLAFTHGGTKALDKAVKAQTVTTTVLDSGLQVGGVLEKYRTDAEGNPIYLHYTGPTQLAYQDKQIENQGPKYHLHGFGTPLGTIKEIQTTAHHATKEDREKIGCVSGKRAKFTFESGVSLEGNFKGMLDQQGLSLIWQFEDCTVKLGDEILFDPSWGTFDMACAGNHIPSVFGGAADRESYIEDTDSHHSLARPQKKNHSEEALAIAPLYQKVRELRDSDSFTEDELKNVYFQLKESFPKDWLLRMEILELMISKDIASDVQSEIRKDLEQLKSMSSSISILIDRGLKLI
jgi:phenylalanine-4-hydroxylase